MASQPVARFSILRDAPDPDRPLVLSIEDDAHHRRHLVGALEGNGFRVESAGSADEAREFLRGPAPDIVLLDLGLPDMDGVDLCRRLVVWPAVPVIVVSADHDEPRVLSAFEAGAVDYVTKPFSTPILLARVRAALRSRGAAAAPAGDTPVVVGDLVLDRSAHLVTVGDETIDLRPREFTVLELLAANEGALVSYAVLVGRRPGSEVSLAELKALRIVISRVRAAIGTGPRTPLIHTESRFGYRLAAADG